MWQSCSWKKRKSGCTPMAGFRAGEFTEGKTGASSLLMICWALSILASIVLQGTQKSRSLSVKSTIQLCPASKLRTFEMTLFANARAADLAPFTGGPLEHREICNNMFSASGAQFGFHRFPKSRVIVP